MDFFEKDEPLDVIDAVYHLEESSITSVDPLANAVHFNPPPFKLHFVQSHFVDGYVRSDGTPVNGYYRDGEFGTGYVRSNPDGIKENNLK
mgnify:CR=1 FL=1